MQINTQELQGVFQPRCQTSANRLLGLLFVAISLLIIAYGGWAIAIDLFDPSQNAEWKYLEIILACVLFFVVPAVLLFIGLIKTLKKPGAYFRGVRIAEEGIEFGIFSIDVKAVTPNEIWDNKVIAEDTVGEWKPIKRCDCNAVSILITLSRRHKLAKQHMLERVEFSSRGACLFQIFGHDSSGLHWNDICAISQGSLYLLGNHEGTYPSDLSSFRERTANIISRWKHSCALSCTLKTISSPANLDRVLAFGVLGGVSAMNEKTVNSCEYQDKIFDSLNDERITPAEHNED
jgi:hypothetical protein